MARRPSLGSSISRSPAQLRTARWPPAPRRSAPRAHAPRPCPLPRARLRIFSGQDAALVSRNVGPTRRSPEDLSPGLQLLCSATLGGAPRCPALAARLALRRLDLLVAVELR